MAHNEATWPKSDGSWYVTKAWGEDREAHFIPNFLSLLLFPIHFLSLSINAQTTKEHNFLNILDQMPSFLEKNIWTSQEHIECYSNDFPEKTYEQYEHLKNVLNIIQAIFQKSSKPIQTKKHKHKP